MKNFIRALSYLTTFLLGSCAVLLYLNFRGIGVSKLDQLEYLILNRFVDAVDSVKIEDAAARAMVASLGDRWSYYVPASEYQSLIEQQENAYVGIGIVISADSESGGFRVLSVQENGSAFRAGVQPEDIIRSVDGTPTEGMTVDDLRNRIRGQEGTTVLLGLERAGEGLELEVTRALILSEVVRYQLLENEVGYIIISNFDSRSAQESIAAIEALLEQGAKSILFDVRNNHGGYAEELVKLLDYLLPEGELFRTVDYAGKVSVDYSDAACLELPMAVLCNQYSYSAAEFFAAALQEYCAGLVVGSPTVGKGNFQYTYALLDGSAVGLSAGRYYTPSGISLADVGIQPDFPVDLPEEAEEKLYYGSLPQEEDTQLQTAVQLLLGQ